MIKIIFPAMVLAGCLACNPIQVTPEHLTDCGPKPTQEQALASAKDVVQHFGSFYLGGDLKDPDSVLVRNVEVLKPAVVYKGLGPSSGLVYGWGIRFEVNAKNTMGGYVGYQGYHFMRGADDHNYKAINF
jgi:hypothetical protein